MKSLRIFKVIFSAAVFASLLSFLSVSYAEDPIVSLRQTSKAFASIAKDVSPAVVNIQSDVSADSADSLDQDADQMDPDIPPPFLDLFKNLDPYRGQQFRRQPIVRQGSGFIITKDGYIVTNNHLVQNATKITVKLRDESEYIGKIIGTDPQSDIAVIKINAKNLPTVTMGDSDAVEVGEWVVALGNPFGLSHSLSAGVLSAKGRSSVGIADYENFLQTDAAINPGNSGGPLLDLDGKVIGINTAIFSRSGGYMGIGFAIPINMAKGIIDQLMAGGNVVRGYLGVKIQELTRDLAEKFGLKDAKGILIAQLEKDSPADKGGLKQGDIIVSLDGKPVENIGNFRNVIASSKPGSPHKVGILRDKKAMDLTVSVGNLSAVDTATKDAVKSPEPETINAIGISIQNVTADIASKLGIKAGVGVMITKVKPGSIAEFAGITRGAIILEVNRKAVNNVKAAKEEFTKAAKSNSVLLLMQDQYGSKYVVIDLK